MKLHELFEAVDIGSDGVITLKDVIGQNAVLMDVIKQLFITKRFKSAQYKELMNLQIYDQKRRWEDTGSRSTREDVYDTFMHSDTSAILHFTGIVDTTKRNPAFIKWDNKSYVDAYMFLRVDRFIFELNYDSGKFNLRETHSVDLKGVITFDSYPGHNVDYLYSVFNDKKKTKLSIADRTLLNNTHFEVEEWAPFVPYDHAL